MFKFCIPLFLNWSIHFIDVSIKKATISPMITFNNDSGIFYIVVEINISSLYQYLSPIDTCSKNQFPMVNFLKSSFCYSRVILLKCLYLIKIRCSVQIIRRYLIYIIIEPVRIQVVRCGSPGQKWLVLRIILFIIILRNINF